MRQLVYVDTSVIGGCFDEEFKEWSNDLFVSFAEGSSLVMLSDLTLRELESAREEVRLKVWSVNERSMTFVGVDDEAIELARTYIEEGALTNKSYNDALHIALATIHNADVLASWNFKHIVNLNRIRLYNSINLRLGYRLIEVRTPREILNNENHEKG